MTLESLKDGENGVITKIKGRGAFRKRIIEMGFVKGKEVSVIKNAPLKDPVEYQVMGYQVSLRRSEANLIEVVTSKEITNNNHNFNGVIDKRILRKSAVEKGKTIDIALVGNPNSGKTTFFNFASNSKEHVGNYAGVTVDSKEAKVTFNGYTLNITDLPGTYSLTPYSPEELYVRDFILDRMPDVVINTVDSSNLERNLYLTTQLIDMDIKVVVGLCMFDELEKRGDKFDYEFLGKMIGIPFIPMVCPKGRGIKEIFKKVIDIYEDKDPNVRHVHLNYGEEIEKSINSIQEAIWQDKSLTDKVSSRYYAIKLLEKDEKILKKLAFSLNYNNIIKIAHAEINRLENCFKEDSETLITEAKYGFISGALMETYKPKPVLPGKLSQSSKIDRLLTHKYLGFPIFIFFLWIMFQTTFSVGAYPMAWIDWVVGQLGYFVNNILPESMIKDLLIGGVIDGVGGVIVFLPNILILFFFISLMEDTGYMARVAFIMDKLMHLIGLHGRSFIPLIMGFGCNVPAIMATRTIKNRGDRLLTMLILPLMSCSARLPVYILIAGAIFPAHAGNVIFSIYLTGILLSIIIAIIFKKTLFKIQEIPFVMELPPYRIPTLKATTRHMWNKGAQYLKKMGGVILIASVIIWVLGYFPGNVEFSKDFDREMKMATNETVLKQLQLEKESEHQANSYIGRIGKFIEPVFYPLGFDWKMSVALITGAAAKEVVVSTMAVLYQAEEQSDDFSASLTNKLREQTYETGKRKGQRIFTPVAAYSFLLFVLIYLPCFAVVAAIRKESGHWKYAAFTIFYTTALAWVVAFLVFQVGGILY